MRAIAKTSTKRRAVAILTAFAIFACYLLYAVFRLDYLNHDYYREKTYDQVTTTSSLGAKRGNIYDANMNILAASGTVWRVFVSTRDIKRRERDDGKDYCKLIASGLSDALSLDTEAVEKKIRGSSVLDVTIKKAVCEEEYERVLEFIRKESLQELVFTEASTSRYYPENTLAAHVLGFTGSDNQGLYGLEYYYDDLLSGEDGYYVYAKDANGNALDTEYSSYFPATDGYSLVTTLDSYIQRELESILETVRINHSVENRVTGIVMNTRTGAILAMATSSPFNPNTPFILDDESAEKLLSSGYSPESEEYKKYKNELLQTMWSNKAVSETYEPGSTFKIVTVSAALDTGAVKESDTFSCSGYCQIGGYRIRCHKTTGHGAGFTLGYGLQMSCNPCMIAVSERVGASRFYSYVERFGYLEKTGIDLPSEASTIFHQEGAIGTTELATISFGQRFKVSVINHLTAIAAVANGGKLVTPYVVQRVIDNEGNTVSEHLTEVRRQVISEEVANAVSQILIDGVNGDGGAKNAAVSGYDIAAKTGTSQKFDVLDENGNSYLRIGSTVGYSVSEDGGVATIIVVDEPTSQVKYGSTVAAPYVSALFEKILPYLDFISSVPSPNVEIKNYVGMSVADAISDLKALDIAWETVGDGDTVIAHTPSGGEVFTYPISKVILYTDSDEGETVKVPELVGLTASEGLKILLRSGLNVKFAGAGATATDGDDIIVEQSLTPGDSVKRGTVITIRAINTKHED